MERQLNGAMIVGDNFVAQKLRERLQQDEIRVWWDNEEMVDNAAYIFDFEGKEFLWESLSNRQRLVVVLVDDFSKLPEIREKLQKSELNWRILLAENVYGEGMSEEGFIGEALTLAARNKNLILPELGRNFSLVAVGDVVEAALRACFVSGTQGKILKISGKETDSLVVAKILFDEAKMTKEEVIQDKEIVVSKLVKLDLKGVEEAESWLRWQPSIEFREGVKGVIQEFVARVDEESRNKKREKMKKPAFVPQGRDYGEARPVSISSDVARKKRERMYEVVVKPVSAPPERDSDVVNPPPSPPLKKGGGKANSEAEEPMTFESLRKKWVVNKDLQIKQEPMTKEDESLIDKFDLLNLKEKPDSVPPERGSDVVNPPPTLKKGGGEPVSAPPLQGSGVARPDSASFNVARKERTTGKYVWWGVGGVVVLVVGWWLVNAVSLLLLPGRIKAAQEMVVKGEYGQAQKEAEKLKQRSENLRQTFSGGEVGALLRAGEEGLSLLELSIDLAQNSDQIREGVFTDKKIDLKTEIEKGQKNAREAVSRMGLLQGRLSGKWEKIPKTVRGKIIELRDRLAAERRKAEILAEVLPSMGQMVGVDSQRREYLVLLQNESELRPGGGFIGSYAILSFEDGKFINFEVQDVYEADGQLKGHVEPPEEIKKYLGEAGWFMRDANWQASFPAAARDIAWFLEKETGRKVDGVIGINLATVKAILKVSGELFVPDFKEKVNADNLYEKAEYYSENNFFPGSVQKASFLGGVSKQLMEEIKNMKIEKGEALLSAILEVLDKNEMQIALNEPQLAAVILSLGWDGSIYDGKCSSDRCLADYLYLVEANFGVNKANYFINRKINRNVEILPNEVKNNLRISYENTAKSNSFPGGDYKNYLRVYMPKEAQLIEVAVTEEGKGRRVVGGTDLVIKEVFGKKEVGFLVTTEVSKKAEVEVKYKQVMSLAQGDKFSYLSYWQKQSGYGRTGVKMTVNVPESWVVGGVEPAAEVWGNQVIFEGELEKDLRMGVEISQ